MVAESESAAMRRQPKQARSQQRVDHLLDTAAEVFGELGYKAATTNAIAARAGVAIGSLYQFFPNKEAILEALVARYTADMRGVYDRILTPGAIEGLTLAQIIQQIVAGIAEFDATHAAFRPMFFSAGPAAHEMQRETVRRVDEMLAARYPGLPADRRRIGAMVCVAIVKGLMPLSEPPDNLPPEQVDAEIVAVTRGHVRAMLLEAGLRLPPDLE